jgi:lysophospholipase L1-like esterase
MYCRALLLLTLLVSIPAISGACPRFMGYKDRNCDGKFVVLFIGDSVVYGTGDINDKGGYVARLRPRLPEVTAKKLGEPGISTTGLLTELQIWTKPRAHLTPESRKIVAADYIVFDVGRNDYYEIDPAYREDPDALEAMAVTAVQNIRSMIIKLKSELLRRKLPRPRFSVATLLPTRRDFQRFYLDGVNTLLLTHITENLPVDVPFHTLDEELMSPLPDGLHPSPEGYEALAKELAHLIKSRFLKTPIPQ